MATKRPRVTTAQNGGLPAVNLDRYRPQDHMLDKAHIRGYIGDILETLLTVPAFLEGMELSQGAGDTVNLSAGCAAALMPETDHEIHADLMVVDDPENPANNPVTSPPHYLLFCTDGLTDVPITGAVLDGLAENFLVVTSEESTHLRRESALSQEADRWYAFAVTDAPVILIKAVPDADDLVAGLVVGTPGSLMITTDGRSLGAGLKTPDGRLVVPGDDLSFQKSSGETLSMTLPSTGAAVTWRDEDGVVGLEADHVVKSFMVAVAQTVAVGDHVVLQPDGTVRKSMWEGVTFRSFGFSRDAGVAGEFVNVQIGGIVSGFSGLIPGEDCYLYDDGAVYSESARPPYQQFGILRDHVPLGVALSATSIQLRKPDWARGYPESSPRLLKSDGNRVEVSVTPTDYHWDAITASLLVGPGMEEAETSILLQSGDLADRAKLALVPGGVLRVDTNGAKVQVDFLEVARMIHAGAGNLGVLGYFADNAGAPVYLRKYTYAGKGNISYASLINVIAVIGVFFTDIGAGTPYGHASLAIGLQNVYFSYQEMLIPTSGVLYYLSFA